MNGDRDNPSIGVSQSDMTSTLPYHLETSLFQGADQLFGS